MQNHLEVAQVFNKNPQIFNYLCNKEEGSKDNYNDMTKSNNTYMYLLALNGCPCKYLPALNDL